MPEDLAGCDKICRPIGNVEGHKRYQSLDLKYSGKAVEGTRRLGKQKVKGSGQETLAELFNMCLFLICSVHPPVS